MAQKKHQPRDDLATDFMDVEQVAEYLGFGQRTIRELAGKGDIPAMKIKGAWRFSRQALLEWGKSESLGNLKG